MKTSDIVQTIREIEQAMKDAGRGEFHGMKLLVRLDEMGYDLTRRPPALIEVPGACATTPQAEPQLSEVPALEALDQVERDRLFA